MARTPLITASALAGLLASGRRVVLLDARPARAAYDEGHFANAHFADLERRLSAASDPGADPARGGRHPLPPLDRWSRQLGEWGIDRETTVVVYDDQSGANAAARAWWMLRSIGHEDGFVLDGGFGAALAEGLATTKDEPRVDPRPPYPASAWQWPTTDIDRVDALRNDPEWKVLDVRSRERFRGETEPIDPIAGHIPGAVNLPYFDNLDDAGLFKAPAELRAQYDALLDGTPVDRLVVHCGSGVTACHTLLALEAAGLRGASLYVGSWGEWCRNPRERG